MEKSKGKIAGFFGGIGRFFQEFGEAVTKGDLSVKLSMIWMGAGYARRRQYVKSALITIYEVLVIVFSVVCSSQYIPKFGTLGTVKRASEFNPVTMKNEINDYDDSFMILLFSVVSIVIWAVTLAVWMSNVRHAYELQKMAERGEHINTFREDLNVYRNEKFYKTLLALPVAGVVVFTVIPLLILILVAFTNYDQQHMPPTELFTWVGLDNFISLFGGGPWNPWIPSKQNTHVPAANEAEDSGIVAIPHLSRDLLACYDGNGSNFGTHPQNVLRGMIYDTKTWEYPYLYNLIDQYRALEKYNNGYTYNMMFVGPGWLNKMGRWEAPYELLKKSYEDGMAYCLTLLSFPLHRAIFWL